MLSHFQTRETPNQVWIVFFLLSPWEVVMPTTTLFHCDMLHPLDHLCRDLCRPDVQATAIQMSVGQCNSLHYHIEGALNASQPF